LKIIIGIRERKTRATMEEDATIPAFWKATQSYLKTIVPEYE